MSRAVVITQEQVEDTDSITLEVVSGVEGPSLYITDDKGGYRLSGPKPWGGGNTIHKFKVDLKELLQQPELKNPIQLAELRARIKEHRLVQHQSTVNLTSARAVAGWSVERVKQLQAQLDELKGDNT